MERQPPLELEEIRELELEYLEELMSEPAGGHNHGRHRTDVGTWAPLETRDPAIDRPSYKRVVEKPRKHGTAYTYRKIKCRCDVCRAWKAEQDKGRKR